MALKPRQNIDQAFVAAMRQIGGVRPTELDHRCDQTKNADIVLAPDNLIIEVKTLMEDFRGKEKAKKKLSEMYENWVRAGKVPDQKGLIRISTADLPPDCANEFMLYVTRRIKYTVRKANDQIKSTRLSLDMPDAKGLLVLCNSGNAFLRPDVVFWSLHHALGRHHSSIDWVIYMTCGLPVRLRGIPEPVDLFTQPKRQGCVSMPAPLFSRIKDAWMGYVAGNTFTRVYTGTDANILNDAEHDRARR